MMHAKLTPETETPRGLVIRLLSHADAVESAKKGVRFEFAIQMKDVGAPAAGWLEIADCALKLAFDDSLEPPGQLANADRGPSSTDIATIITFLRVIARAGGQGGTLAVQCDAGNSRSGAVGMIALQIFGRDPSTIVELRPSVAPNVRITGLADAFLATSLTDIATQLCATWDTRMLGESMF